jgi:hypothetical protein
MLTLDMPETAGSRDMPPVVFLHGKHTKALEEEGCKACHNKTEGEKEPEGFSFSFKNTRSLPPEAAMEAYHEECSGCHQRTMEKAKPSGPLTGQCRACHRPDPDLRSAWEPILFSKSLHYRHASSSSIKFKPQEYDKNCGACHHVYNEELEKTVYKEGEEGSCRYCHKESRTDDTRSFRNAAHTDCVNCHIRLSEADKDAGPVLCEGCHSRRGKAKIEKLEEVPRMKAGQPDAVLMAAWIEEAAKEGKLPSQRMQPVAFNHKKHENAADFCRTCHHASLEPCMDCHTLTGAEDGEFVSIETAMHDEATTKSCVGCHEVQKTHKDCAGCHSLMDVRAFADRDCRHCHGVGEDLLKPLPQEEEDAAKIAASAISQRAETRKKIRDEDIPEKVTIDIMADVYEGATFPHRKITAALSEKIEKSELARRFHGSRPETLCMGCHHNSPASLTPPRCASCHNPHERSGETDRPGLKGAYHGQCIDCHDQMGIEKPAATDCTGCHKKRSAEKEANRG